VYPRDVAKPFLMHLRRVFSSWKYITVFFYKLHNGKITSDPGVGGLDAAPSRDASINEDDNP